MSSNYKNSKKSLFLFLICCLAVWLGAFILFRTIYQKRNLTNNLAAEITFLVLEKEEIKNLADEIEFFRPKISELDQFLVGGTQEGIVKFIELIESLASLSNVEIEVNTVAVSEIDEPDLSSNYESLNLALEALGDWKNIFHFLNLLENLPYKLVIGRIELGQVNVVEEGFKWKGDFELSVVKFK